MYSRHALTLLYNFNAIVKTKPRERKQVQLLCIMYEWQWSCVIPYLQHHTYRGICCVLSVKRCIHSSQVAAMLLYCMLCFYALPNSNKQGNYARTRLEAMCTWSASYGHDNVLLMYGSFTASWVAENNSNNCWHCVQPLRRQELRHTSISGSPLENSASCSLRAVVCP